MIHDSHLHCYVLRDRVPVPATMSEWARMFEDIDQRRVALDVLADGVEVSTVFLGVDHNFMPEEPPDKAAVLAVESLPANAISTPLKSRLQGRRAGQ